LFARDLRSNRTELVSIDVDGNTQTGYRGKAEFSHDSRFVAFVGNIYPYAVLLRDLLTKTTIVLWANNDAGFQPTAYLSLSGNGRWIVFDTVLFGTRQILLKDLQNGTITVM